MDCLFCKISDHRIPADIVHEDERCLAFRDLHPAAPTHLLVIPKRHLSRIDELESEEDGALMGHLVLVATRIATAQGLAQGGYRLVVNCGEDGGQSVFHVHLHLLGGRRLSWPPG